MRFAIFALSAALACVPSVASSEILNAELISRGYVNQAGLNNGASPLNSYYAGREGAGGEVANFFSFKIPDFAGEIHSADLVLDFNGASGYDFGEDGYISYSNLTYIVTSLANQDFSNLGGPGGLGTGTYYGGIDTINQYGPTLTLSLNAAALANIRPNSVFSIGGRVSYPTLNGGVGNLSTSIFQETNASSQSLLVLNTLPEPGTWLMMLGGFAMVGTAVRRRPKVSVSYA